MFRASTELKLDETWKRVNIGIVTLEKNIRTPARRIKISKLKKGIKLMLAGIVVIILTLTVTACGKDKPVPWGADFMHREVKDFDDEVEQNKLSEISDIISELSQEVDATEGE